MGDTDVPNRSALCFNLSASTDCEESNIYIALHLRIEKVMNVAAQRGSQGNNQNNLWDNSVCP